MKISEPKPNQKLKFVTIRVSGMRYNKAQRSRAGEGRPTTSKVGCKWGGMCDGRNRTCTGALPEETTDSGSQKAAASRSSPAKAKMLVLVLGLPVTHSGFFRQVSKEVPRPNATAYPPMAKRAQINLGFWCASCSEPSSSRVAALKRIACVCLAKCGLYNRGWARG